MEWNVRWLPGSGAKGRARGAQRYPDPRGPVLPGLPGGSIPAPLRGGCDSFLMVREQALGPRGTPALGAIGTLADVDLGWAIRREVGAATRLATFGLTLRIIRDEPATRLDSCGEVISSWTRSP